MEKISHCDGESNDPERINPFLFRKHWFPDQIFSIYLGDVKKALEIYRGNIKSYLRDRHNDYANLCVCSRELREPNIEKEVSDGRKNAGLQVRDMRKHS